jgi:GGDEF domain-containing protein
MVQEAERGRRLAIYDPSSNVLAQWYFELRLLEECLRAQRYDLPLVVLTLQGSLASKDDEVNALGFGRSEASRIAASSIRRTDFVGSLGFSGFAICLIHCDRRGAAPVIKRLMNGLGEGDWQLGIAVHPDDGLEGKELIQLAMGRSAPWKAPLRSEVKAA